jgi:hypothetical protein
MQSEVRIPNCPIPNHNKSESQIVDLNQMEEAIDDIDQKYEKDDKENGQIYPNANTMKSEEAVQKKTVSLPMLRFVL